MNYDELMESTWRAEKERFLDELLDTIWPNGIRLSVHSLGQGE